MELIKVGEVNPRFIGLPDGMSATITDSGIQVIDTRYQVSMQEAEQYGEKIQFKTGVIEGISFLFMRPGNLNWTDMPIKLDGKLAENIADGEGYSVNLIFADTATGIVIENRLIGLSTKFSKQINKNLKETGGFNFTPQEMTKLRRIQEKYSTKEAIKFANGYYN